MKLLLIRHGESEGNAQNRFQGQREYPLSERGVAQSRALAERLRLAPPDALYSSPLLRAMQTAQPTAAATGLPVESLPGVMEYHFGDLSGMTWEEIAALHPELAAAHRSRGRSYVPWPGEEGREVFRDRVFDALWPLAERHPRETVAVFTHGGVVGVFCAAVLGLDPRHRAPFMVDNTAIFELELRERRGVLLSANDACHLRHDPATATRPDAGIP